MNEARFQHIPWCNALILRSVSARLSRRQAAFRKQFNLIQPGQNLVPVHTQMGYQLSRAIDHNLQPAELSKGNESGARKDNAD